MNLLTKRMKEMVQPSFASSELYDILNKIKSNVESLEDSNPQKYLWLGEIKDITIDPKNSHLLLLAINNISSLWNLVIHDKYLFGIDKNDSDIISIIPLYYINNLVESRYEFVPCTVYLHGKYLEPDFIIASKSKAIINEMLSILPMMNPKLKNSAKVVGESDEPETDIDYQEKMEKLIDRKDPEGLAGLADKYSSDINMDEKVQVNYKPENPDIALTSTPVSEGVDPFIIATYMNKIKKSDVEIVQNADEADVGLDIFKDEKSNEEENMEPVKLDDIYNLNEALTAKERKKLKDEDFGIPSLRKYPLHDPAHVYAAIKFFNYIDKDHEKELAKNIIKAANKFDIPIEPGEKNKLRKYVKVTLKKKQAPPKKDDIYNVAVSESAVIKTLRKKPTKISNNLKIELDDKHYVPVYIILTKSDTMMGNVIRKVTGEKYNHASIAVDYNLTNLYSFARRDDGSGGLVIESTKDGRLAELMHGENPTEYALYVTFLSHSKYENLENKLNHMVNNIKKYKYNMLQLLKLPLGIENRSKRAMICSEFVGTLLKEGDETLITKAPSLLTPGELVNPKFYFVSEGVLKDYEPKNTKHQIDQLVTSNRIYTFLTESGIGNYINYSNAFGINRSSSYLVDIIDYFFPTTLVEFDALLSMTNGGTFFDIYQDGYEQGILNYDPNSNFYGVDLSNDESHLLFSYTIQSLIKRLFINKELFTKKMTEDQLEKTMTLIGLWMEKVKYYYDQMKVTNDKLSILTYKQRLLDLGWAPSNDPFDNVNNEFLKVAIMVELGVIWDPIPEARLDYGKIDKKVNELLDDSIFLTIDRRFPIFDQSSLLLAAYHYSLLEEFEKSDFMEKWLNRYEYLGCSFKLSPNLLFSKDLPKEFKSLVQEEEYSMLNEAIKTKSYNIELADDGSLNIKTKLTSDIETMYRDSLRNIKIYKQNDNIEGLKKEAVILKYMIDLITNTYGNQKINKKINNPAKYKQMMDLRAIMINTWSQTVTYIVSKEPDFDFTEHYNKSDYGKDIKLTQNELVTSAKLIGAVFKSLTGL